MRFIRLSPLGLWHKPRTGNGGSHTACGLPIRGPVAARDDDLELDLCPQCFSKHERDTARMRKLHQSAVRDAEAEAWFDDEEETWPDEDGITEIPYDDHEHEK